MHAVVGAAVADEATLVTAVVSVPIVVVVLLAALVVESDVDVEEVDVEVVVVIGLPSWTVAVNAPFTTCCWPAVHAPVCWYAAERPQLENCMYKEPLRYWPAGTSLGNWIVHTADSPLIRFAGRHCPTEALTPPI